MAFETGANAQQKPYTMYDLRNGRNMTIIEDVAKTMKPRVVKTKGKNGDYEVARLKINTGIMNGELELSESNWNKLWRALPPSVVTLKNVTIAYDSSKDEITFVCQDNGTHNLDPSVPLNENAKLEKIAADIKYLNKVGVQVDIKALTNICDAIQPGKAVEFISAAKTGGYIVETNGVYIAP